MTPTPGSGASQAGLPAAVSKGAGLGRGRSLARPAFGDDDGRADPRLRSALASGAPVDLALLGRSRLLVAVVAIADEAPAEHPASVAGRSGEQGSQMAVVSMVNAAGEKGLLAFTGIDALHAWDRHARPVPVTGTHAARAALGDGAAALVIDVRGPARLVVAGHLLLALAQSEPSSLPQSSRPSGPPGDAQHASHRG